MKNFVKTSTLLFLTSLFLLGCGTTPDTNVEKKILQDGTEVVNKKPTINPDETQFSDVRLLNTTAHTFASEYVDESMIGSSVNYFVQGLDNYMPETFMLTWTCNGGYKYFLIYMSTSEDMSEITEYVTQYPMYEFDRLNIGTTYYFQIQAFYTDYSILSKTYTFTTGYTVRSVYVEGVNNTRDIGGSKIGETHRVKLGKVIRGGHLDYVTYKGKNTLTKKEGVKTDVDLRESHNMNESGVSPLGSNIKYVQFGRGGPYYINSDTGINSESEYRENLKKYLQVFAVEENYPIYLHCAIGRDRTGTISFLLNALCGVDKLRLFLDYEFSFLSKVTETADQIYELVDSIYAVYVFLMGNFEGETLADKTENFMLDLGLTQQEIDNIRNILIEEIK